MILNFKQRFGMKLYRCLSYLLLLLTGCIEPLELDIKQDDVRLVVDGLITDEPGPYTITLTKTQSVPYTPQAIPREVGATLTISDDLGNTNFLYEISPGIYETQPGFQGKMNQTYTLHITTAAGEKFTSTPETLRAVPEIDNISYEVEKRIALDKENQPSDVYWLNAYIDTKDKAGEKNYYKWEYEVVYQVDTQPWDYCEPNPRGTMCIPKPKRCCSTCWVTIYNDAISIQNDRLVNGNELKKQFITKLPVNNQIFNSRLQLEVKQFSISETAYDYLKVMKSQLIDVSNIQSPPPATIIGNINGLDKTAKKPLGFFGASSVKKKAIFISTKDLGVGLRPLIYPDDCRAIDNSTALRPFYW